MSTRPSKVELELLFARLKWPVPSVRLWVAQGLAALLLTAEYKQEVEEQLRVELAACFYEIETVELLSVCLLAHYRGYSVPADLGRCVAAPSPLSSLLLRIMKCGFEPPKHLSNSFKLAPGAFQAPDDFYRANGREFPSVLSQLLSQLEIDFRVPAMMQFAYEWESSKLRCPPREHDVSHFLGYPRDNLTGQFVTDSAQRGRSAYLRVLSVAGKYWGMPREFAEGCALAVLPIHPTLAFLQPSRPEWLPQLDVDPVPGKTQIDSFVSTLLRRANEDIHTLLAGVSTELSYSADVVLDLNLVLCFRSNDIAPDDEELAGIFREIGTFDWQDFDCTNSVYSGKDFASAPSGAASSRALAVKAHPEQYAYLHSDVISRGIFLPRLLDGSTECFISPDDGSLRISASSNEIGDIHFWNVDWKPAHVIDAGPKCGTSLRIRKTALSVLLSDTQLDLFYAWECRQMHRNEQSGEYTTVVIRGAVSLNNP